MRDCVDGSTQILGQFSHTGCDHDYRLLSLSLSPFPRKPASDAYLPDLYKPMCALCNPYEDALSPFFAILSRDDEQIRMYFLLCSRNNKPTRYSFLISIPLSRRAAFTSPMPTSCL